MRHINATFAKNNYYWSPIETTVTDFLKLYIPAEFLEGLDDVSYFNLLLGYGDILTPDVDLFQYFEASDIEMLKNDKNNIVLFDSTFEGYSAEIETLARTFENSCAKHNIDPRKIFLLTGNLEKIKFETRVNVIPVFLLHLTFQHRSQVFGATTIEESKEVCGQKLDKLVLSLSRRNRDHRVWGHFMLSRSSIFNDCMISQDKLDDFHTDTHILPRIGEPIEVFETFKNSLPLLADGDNFHINSPFNNLPELHSATLFSIVNETLCVNYNNTSLFFSEKFLKPVINFQPMLLWGQQGVNKRLATLGFKTYESYFNLDFDDEPDDILRYKKLLASVTDTVNYLKSLTRDQQVEWRYKEVELLEYNRKLVFDNTFVSNQINELLIKVREIIS